MNKEKQIEKDELFGILSNTINGANFDDLSEAVYKISDVAGYRKQSEGELTKAHIEAHYEAICALADMVGQFGYSTTFRKQKAICDGGLSALEYAFGALQDCGCKINSNGSITLKNLWAFQEEFEAKMKGGAE